MRFYKMKSFVQSYDDVLFPFSIEIQKTKKCFSYERTHFVKSLSIVFCAILHRLPEKMCYTKTENQKNNWVKNNITLEQRTFCLTSPERTSFCNLRNTAQIKV